MCDLNFLLSNYPLLKCCKFGIAKIVFRKKSDIFLIISESHIFGKIFVTYIYFLCKYLDMISLRTLSLVISRLLKSTILNIIVCTEAESKTLSWIKIKYIRNSEHSLRFGGSLRKLQGNKRKVLCHYVLLIRHSKIPRIYYRSCTNMFMLQKGHIFASFIYPKAIGLA